MNKISSQKAIIEHKWFDNRLFLLCGRCCPGKLPEVFYHFLDINFVFHV